MSSDADESGMKKLTGAALMGAGRVWNRLLVSPPVLASDEVPLPWFRMST